MRQTCRAGRLPASAHHTSTSRGLAIRATIWLILLFALAACEDTAVHTTPPAPLDSEGAPTVSVEPQTIGPNMPIVVSGAGFPADTTVELHVNPDTAGFVADPLAQGQTDANGNVTLNAQVPALWFDGTPLAGPELRLELTTEDGDIRGVAVVPFEPGELESFLTINPPSGAPGQEVQLVGHGFEPGAELLVRLGVSDEELVGIDLAAETVGADGTVEALITIPTTWPASGAAVTEPALIIALIDADSNETVATASFSNNPEQSTP